MLRRTVSVAGGTSMTPGKKGSSSRVNPLWLCANRTSFFLPFSEERDTLFADGWRDGNCTLMCISHSTVHRNGVRCPWGEPLVCKTMYHLFFLFSSKEYYILFIADCSWAALRAYALRILFRSSRSSEAVCFYIRGYGFPRFARNDRLFRKSIKSS